jgi:adenylate kinase family enzyme
MRIHIIGLHGSGKTTLAHLLSARLSIPWFSLGATTEYCKRSSETQLFERELAGGFKGAGASIDYCNKPGGYS